MPHDLAFLDATAQADLVRRKEVTPRELVDAAIARIEAVNPNLMRLLPRCLKKHVRKQSPLPCPMVRFVEYPSC